MKQDNSKCSLLCTELNAVIEKSTATYGDAVKALKWLLVAYEDKGEALLDGTSIHEVAVQRQDHSTKLPPR